jgi:predicted transport protein
MVSFDDHVAYAEPQIRPVLRELQKRIRALGSRIEERPTRQQRIAYRVNDREFLEVKVQKRRILIRFFEKGVADPKGLIKKIPIKHNWLEDREIPVDNFDLVNYAMSFIEASYRSRLTWGQK